MTSSSQAVELAAVRSSLESDDSLMAPPMQWYESSMLKQVQDAYDTVHNISTINFDDPDTTSTLNAMGVQRYIIKHLTSSSESLTLL